mgnify:CR=1 FL=1
MKEILEAIIKSLVENENEVVVTEKNENEQIVLEVKVSPNDMGRVIGKQGRMAKSIRTVIKAIAVSKNKKVNIEFID